MRCEACSAYSFEPHREGCLRLAFVNAVDRAEQAERRVAAVENMLRELVANDHVAPWIAQIIEAALPPVE